MKEFFKKIFTKENMKKFFFSFIWLMVLVFALDIMSKWLVVNHFNRIPATEKAGTIQLIPDFLYIGLSYNKGAAWSLGANSQAGRIIFIVVSFVLGGGLIAYYAYASHKGKLNTVIKISLALMIAGAIGNLIDRAFYWESTVGFSGVVDWISVWFGSYHFPIFNLADSALVVGVAILLVYVIVESIKDAIKASKEGQYKYSPKELKEAEKAKNEENKDK
ncbi:MAG: signal peptidase II [Firmicutes bacterium]|nr:signal peptidase II [Candidatus Fiminaster equi]